MAANQTIEYAPQCGDLTVKSLTFHNNNVVGVFRYPETALAYHEICKYLINCPLAEAFTKTPSMVYQNLLREFCCTIAATHPNPPADTFEVIPLKEYKIKFSVINGKKPLNFDYKTFFKSNGLDYAKGTYVSHPYPEVVKAELAKIVENSILSDRTPGQRFISCALAELLGLDYTQDESFGSSPTILSKSNFLKDPSTVTPIELTDFMVAVNKREHSVNPLSFSVKKKKKEVLEVAQPYYPVTGPEAPGMAKTMPRLEGPLGDKDLEGNKPHADMEPINPTITDPSGTGIEYQAQHEEAVVSYADPRASVEGYYEENIANRDQTDKLVEASMSSLKKSRIATIKYLQAAALKQDEYLASWAKSSNFLAWNLGPRMTAVESSQAAIRYDISPLRKDTSKIKSMMSEIYQAISRVADTEEPHSYTEGEHVAMEDDKAEKEPTREVALIESPSKPPLTDPILEILVPKKEGKAIANNYQPDVQTKLMHASKEVLTNPDAPIIMPYEINGIFFQLTEKQIQAYMDKEEHIKKATEEDKIFEMTKIEVIKVVQ
ncbi:hypothetical protein Tco_1212910 [Tanacetum coccineum]